MKSFKRSLFATYIIFNRKLAKGDNDGFKFHSHLSSKISYLKCSISAYISNIKKSLNILAYVSNIKKSLHI